MDPTKQYPPEYLAEDRSRTLINVVVAFAILESFFVALFFISRFMNHTARGWDVYLMVPAYITCFGHIIVASIQIEHGGAGRHVVALEPAVVVRWLKMNVAEEFIYNASIMFPKLSILCLYARVFTTKPYRYATYAIGAVVVATFLAGQIVGIAICQPFSYIWNKTSPGGHCGDIPAAYRYISIPNLVTDVCLIALPLRGVWALHAKTVHKIGLTLTFLTGCIGIITGIIRVVYFFSLNMFDDVTWHSSGTMTWTLVEPGVYLIAATLPSLRPLVRYFFKDVDFGTVYHRLLDQYTRVFSTQKTATQKTANASQEDLQSTSENEKLAIPAAAKRARSAGFVRIEDWMSHGREASKTDNEMSDWP